MLSSRNVTEHTLACLLENDESIRVYKVPLSRAIDAIESLVQFTVYKIAYHAFPLFPFHFTFHVLPEDSLSLLRSPSQFCACNYDFNSAFR